MPSTHLIAVRFKTGPEVDRAIDIIYSDPRLKGGDFDSPDGYELHVSKESEAVLREHGLVFTTFSL